MKKVNIIYVGVLLMLLTSCAVRKSSSTNAPALVETTWQLVELKGEAVPEKVNDKMPFLRLYEENGRYGASGGCNGIGGEYTLEKDNGVKFSRGFSTMMACKEMDIEHGLRELFEEADAYAVQENTLILSNKESGEVLAKFTATDEEE